jgi:hypothetical protein
MHVLIRIRRAGRQHRAQQALALGRAREEELPGSRQQRQAHGHRLGREAGAQGLQQVRRVLFRHSVCTESALCHWVPLAAHVLTQKCIPEQRMC